MQSNTHMLLSLWIMTRIYFKKRECEDRHVSCLTLGFSVAEKEKKKRKDFLLSGSEGVRAGRSLGIWAKPLSENALGE